MNRLFKNKRKEPPGPFPQGNFPTVPANIAVRPVSYQARSNIGPEGGRARFNQGPEADRPDLTVALDDRTGGVSQIVFRDRMDEEGELHASVASTSGVVVDGTERGNSRMSECF